MLRPEAIGEIPAQTARVAKATVPEGSTVIRPRDAFGTLPQDEDGWSTASPNVYALSQHALRLPRLERALPAELPDGTELDAPKVGPGEVGGTYVGLVPRHQGSNESALTSP